jgi:hypothetical protein
VGQRFICIFSVDCGVRQGGVLSPYLFAIYVDDIVKKINRSDLGCRLGLKRIAVVLYADDIILMAPSVESLQMLLNIVEEELIDLDMTLNTKNQCACELGQGFNLCVTTSRV